MSDLFTLPMALTRQGPIAAPGGLTEAAFSRIIHLTTLLTEALQRCRPL